MKKLLAVLLCLIVGIFSTGCQTNDVDRTNENKEHPKLFEYQEISGGMEITRYIGNDEKVVIPEIIDNKKVISIAEEAFSGNVKLQEITLPEGIDQLNFDLFKNCTSLSKITYNGTIHSASGSFTFYSKLSALKTIEFTKLNENAIHRLNELVRECGSLENIVIKEIVGHKEEAFVINISGGFGTIRELVNRKINIIVPPDVEKAYMEMPVYKKYIVDDGAYKEYINDGLGGYAAFEGISLEWRGAPTKISDKDKSKIEERIKGNMDELIEWEIYNDGYTWIGRMKKDNKEFVFTGGIKLRDSLSENEELVYQSIEHLWDSAVYERIDNVNAMPIIFGVSDITVNGKDYKFTLT